MEQITVKCWKQTTQHVIPWDDILIVLTMRTQELILLMVYTESKYFDADIRVQKICCKGVINHIHLAYCVEKIIWSQKQNSANKMCS
jgi:hypothetical protein